MKVKDRQFDSFSIVHETLEVQHSAMIKHNFHELLFISSGRGIHINGHSRTQFVKGDLFLVKPNEEHAHIIEESTDVYVVRFSESTRLQLKDMVHQSNGKAAALRKAKSPLNFKVSFSEKDEILIVELLKLLIILNQDQVRNENICYYQLLCFIAIIERNVIYYSKNTVRRAEKKKITQVLEHIHKYLKDPEMLGLQYIATKLNMSTNQLGVHFRKEMNQSVKHYINECRLQLVGKKVLESEMTFSQIAHQFGYVDESHFYKSFKKFYGVSPTIYRKARN